jgi:hypothetical protein
VATTLVILGGLLTWLINHSLPSGFLIALGAIALAYAGIFLWHFVMLPVEHARERDEERSHSKATLEAERADATSKLEAQRAEANAALVSAEDVSQERLRRAERLDAKAQDWHELVELWRDVGRIAAIGRRWPPQEDTRLL